MNSHKQVYFFSRLTWIFLILLCLVLVGGFLYSTYLSQTSMVALQEFPITVEKEIEETVLEDVREEPLTEKEQIDLYIYEIASRYNLEPELIQSIVWHESRYTPKAKTGNCLGLMQVSTEWHKARAEQLGVIDFFDPFSNLLLGTDYISELYNAYGDMGYALMLYNMRHDVAHQLHKEGKLSGYASSVLARAEKIKQGVI